MASSAATLGFLLDTNILSETSKPRPNAGCLAFMTQVKLADIFISVITLGELKRGILVTNDPVKRAGLASWLQYDVYGVHESRILAVDDEVMSIWANMIVATGRKFGQLPVFDGLLAATALHHRLTVVTRNVANFRQFGVSIFNPFEDSL